MLSHGSRFIGSKSDVRTPERNTYRGYLVLDHYLVDARFHATRHCIRIRNRPI
jgi:hypothetical protein